MNIVNSIIKSDLVHFCLMSAGPTLTPTPQRWYNSRTVVNGVDIDRLHYVIENRPHVHRGAGKTFARIQELIGELQLGETKFLVPLTKWRDISYVKADLLNALSNVGVKATYNVDTKTLYGPETNRFTIQFCTVGCLDQRLRGWRPVIIPMGWYD